MDRRSLFYWSKVYSKSLREGQDYQKLPNVISVNIVGFDFPRGGGFHTCFRLREDTDPSLVLTNALEIHYINMVKWRKLEGKDVRSNPLHRWLAWFDEDSPPDLVEEVIHMDKAIMAANERQAFVTQDEEALQVYWRRQKAEWDFINRFNGAHDEGLEQGLAEGLVKGRQEGIEQTTIEIARKMKTASRPLAEIKEFTGLSPEAIEKL